MAYSISTAKMNEIIGKLSVKYDVYAPKRFEKRGFKPGSDLIRYGMISDVREIVHDVKSDFSPKEVFYPISLTMLYFAGDKCMQSEVGDKGTIIFARPCDINGIRRLDEIFLKNGGTEDIYYKRLRQKVKIFMIECDRGWQNCFCVSMDSNRADDYSAAFRFGEEGILACVKDESFYEYFADCRPCEFEPSFVEKNEKDVRPANIDSLDVLKDVYGLKMWKDYGEKCIGCGACNAVCITCSCFNTVDVIYDESSKDGERRRVWGSCMMEDFTAMAGGHRVRKDAGEQMRFRTLHKIYDYKARFGRENMCVGCGRCDDRCPAEISFSGIIKDVEKNIVEASK